MKKWLIILTFTAMLIVGCSNKDEAKKLEEQPMSSDEVNVEEQTGNSKEQQVETTDENLNTNTESEKKEQTGVEQSIQKNDLTEAEKEELIQTTVELYEEVLAEDAKFQQIIEEFNKNQFVKNVDYTYTDIGIQCEISFNNGVNENEKKEVMENLKKEFLAVDNESVIEVIEK